VVYAGPSVLCQACINDFSSIGPGKIDIPYFRCVRNVVMNRVVGYNVV